MSNDQLVKVFVRLDRDEDGYPPVDWEELWAADLGHGAYRVDNIPFYAQLLSHGDTVAVEERDGRLVVVGVTAVEGHSTVRVVAHDETITPKLRAELRSIGCPSELSNIPSFFAVDVPPEVNYSVVAKLIASYADSGAIDYEESSLQH